MEEASDYRKPVYFLLERAGSDCMLEDADRAADWDRWRYRLALAGSMAPPAR